MTLDPVMLSCVQFGFTVTFHIIFRSMSTGSFGDRRRFPRGTTQAIAEAGA